MKKRLILFDFDGTITTRDTFIEFLIFYNGWPRFIMGMAALSPLLALYAVKLIPNWKAKQIVLRHFFSGEELDTFNERCAEFSSRVLPKLIRPGAVEVIEHYKRAQATVAVVSASAENWVGPWCNAHGIACIATQLDVVNGKITGNLCGPNCYGPEKVKRIEKQFQLKDFQEIIAYGDSSGDREMFGISHAYHYKPFREKLKEVSRTTSSVAEAR